MIKVLSYYYDFNIYKRNTYLLIFRKRKICKIAKYY